MWIVIFFLMGVYLLGKLKFPHDSEMKFLKFPRLCIAIIVFSFVMYMIPGMFGAPLKMLSGWLPPETTQDFDINAIVRQQVETAAMMGNTKTDEELCDMPKFADFLFTSSWFKRLFRF